LGVLSINTGQIVRGSTHTMQNYTSALLDNQDSNTLGAAAVKGEDGKQEVTINVATNGYTSPVSTIKAGEPVRLKLVSNNAVGCARAFMIPSLGVSKVLPENGTEVIEFTPTETGILSYTCSMGMYTGQLTII
jgi:uncharacterized protein